MSNIELLEYKDWDSAFFNQAIYHMDAGRFGELEERSFDHLRDALIQTKVPSDSLEALDVLQQSGFNLVESELTFEYKVLNNIKNRENSSTIQIALVEDIPKIVELVSNSFVYSRFRYPWFKKTDASLFYAEWARKAVLHQYDDVCLKIVNSGDKSICGIITAMRLNETEARIGLICVSGQYQGNKFGKALLRAIENWSFIQGIKKIYVSTQGSNQRSCLFYLSNQYQLNAINYWFYRRVPG